MAPRVAVLATGGTIATHTDGSGTAVVRPGRREVLGHLPLPAGVAVAAEDVHPAGGDAAAEPTRRGRVVVTSTPLASGAVVPVHGDEGGADLRRADADAVRAASTGYVDPATRAPDRPPVARTRG